MAAAALIILPHAHRTTSSQVSLALSQALLAARTICTRIQTQPADSILYQIHRRSRASAAAEDEDNNNNNNNTYSSLHARNNTNIVTRSLAESLRRTQIATTTSSVHRILTCRLIRALARIIKCTQSINLVQQKARETKSESARKAIRINKSRSFRSIRCKTDTRAQEISFTLSLINADTLITRGLSLSFALFFDFLLISTSILRGPF